MMNDIAVKDVVNALDELYQQLAQLIQQITVFQADDDEQEYSWQLTEAISQVRNAEDSINIALEEIRKIDVTVEETMINDAFRQNENEEQTEEKE